MPALSVKTLQGGAHRLASEGTNGQAAIAAVSHQTREDVMKIYFKLNTALPPFIPLPRFMLAGEYSINAKLLYGLLLNRTDRKSTRLNSSHIEESRMPSSA